MEQQRQMYLFFVQILRQSYKEVAFIHKLYLFRKALNLVNKQNYFTKLKFLILLLQETMLLFIVTQIHPETNKDAFKLRLNYDWNVNNLSLINKTHLLEIFFLKHKVDVQDSNAYIQSIKVLIITILILIIILIIYQMLKKNHIFVVLIVSTICLNVFAKNGIPSLQPYTAIINLNLPPSQRYFELSQQKSDHINKFIEYLHQNQQFALAFSITKFILFIAPQFAVKYWIGGQFYQECQGVAKGTQKHLSQIIVFNYMYELGAWREFCTSIPFTQRIVSNNKNEQNSNNIDLLARNLDYGFQQFLSQNSIRFQYYKDGEKLFTSVCHAGIVGTHTSLRYRSSSDKSKSIQYAITLNQRIQGGLHLTLLQIFTTRCQRSLQVIMRLQKSGSQSVQDLIKQLSQANTCSGVYFMIHTEDGENIIIQKNRGTTIHKITRNSVSSTDQLMQSRKIAFLLQTNTDSDKPDPDTRRTIGTERMNALIDEKTVLSKEDIKNVLLQYPNFNPYTLMTALLDVKNGQVEVLVWTKNSFQQLTK